MLLSGFSEEVRSHLLLMKHDTLKKYTFPVKQWDKTSFEKITKYFIPTLLCWSLFFLTFQFSQVCRHLFLHCVLKVPLQHFKKVEV